MEDILSERGEGEDREVEVKWENWDGPTSWVRLADNPELSAFLTQNQANPDSSTLAKLKLGVSPSDPPSEIMAIRQAIHDSLGDGRHTSEGHLGRQTRISIKMPFSTKAFDDHFRSNNLPGVASTGHGNVSCYVTGDDLTKVLGLGWSSRAYNTNTVTYVNFKELIQVQWGYKARFTISHSACKR